MKPKEGKSNPPTSPFLSTFFAFFVGDVLLIVFLIFKSLRNACGKKYVFRAKRYKKMFFLCVDNRFNFNINKNSFKEF